MPPSGPPLVNGSVFRAYVEHVKELGLLDEVLPRLTAEARALVEKPPFALSWIESRLSDEIAIALYELRGRDAVRAMGRAQASGPLAKLLKPLIGTTVELFGGTPAAVFAKVESFLSLLVRNVEFGWTPRGPRAGTLTVRHSTPTHDAAFANWEGVFTTAFAYAKHEEGTVHRARLVEGGRAAQIEVSW